MESRKRKLYGLALCAGVGGLERGIALFLGDQYRCVGYCERESFAASVLVARMEDSLMDRAPIWSDVETFPSAAYRGRVDIVSAGYPCQPFSLIGKRKGTADPRHLWPHVLRVVRETEAPIVFCENVRAHIKCGFDIVEGDLRDIGYMVEAGIFSAQEVGAPHRRERLFFLAANRKGYETLADNCGERLERPIGTCIQEWKDTDGSIRSGSGGVVAFPPPPDSELWEEVPDNLQPGFLGLDDGLDTELDKSEGWTDRLRAAGNGVVPAQAALAFHCLMGRLMFNE